MLFIKILVYSRYLEKSTQLLTLNKFKLNNVYNININTE